MSELQQAAALINRSTTGAIATVMTDRVSVLVPGILVVGGQPNRTIYTTENIRSVRAAIRLVQSME